MGEAWSARRVDVCREVAVMPKLNHVLETALYFDDLDAAQRFYEQVLELTPIFSDARLRAYAIGNTVLLLFKRGASMAPVELPGGVIAPHDGAGPVHVAFAVGKDELEPWEHRLAAHDVVIESRMRWPRGSVSIYFRDPGNHLLELATPGLWVNY
jgi:catechol 2,3-dioxygenase-like lactoylglutathione lyase family enzyme